MKRLGLAAILVVAAGRAASAEPVTIHVFGFSSAPLGGTASAPPGTGAACESAGHTAEQARGLPANLLISIGLVESGHPDPLSGHYTPWPWTVNADGEGRYFANKADAVAFARLALSSGARDVDVGCFQVSLEAHPDAFASLEGAFDPGQNAAYAATFLTQLKNQSGSWKAAIADYHSSLPNLGLPYQRQVLARWQRLGNMPPDLGADIAQAAAGATDPYVIMQSAAARSVHVYYGAPGAAAVPVSRTAAAETGGHAEVVHMGGGGGGGSTVEVIHWPGSGRP